MKWIIRSLYQAVHGVMPPRRSPRRSTGRGPVRNWRYRQWIRSLPCACCDTTVEVEAAHTGKDGGTALKASDTSCVPLCAWCHRLGAAAYHRIGRKDFERRHGLDLSRIVKTLNQTWQLGREDAA